MPERHPDAVLPGDEVFADGNMAAVVRRGDEVRRGQTPWASASHAVLRHLEAAGFPFSPRFLGSEGDVDRYSFVPGETAPADLAGYGGDGIVEAVGRMTRAYHDAMAGFVPPPDIVWPIMPGMPPSDGTICHNDLAPWNVVFRNGLPAGLIDWDLVAPATRTWDLAYAAWRFAPLYPGDAFGSTGDRVRRVRLLLDAYGLPASARGAFPREILARMGSAYETVERWGAAGVPGFARLYRERLHVDALEHMTWVKAEFAPMW